MYKNSLFINNNKELSSNVNAIINEINRGKKAIDVKEELLNEIVKRLSNFKEWFVYANRRFMDVILSNEIDFVDNLENNKVEDMNLKAMLQGLKELNKSKTIMQIGKGTNYVVKTYGIAFSEIYEKYFSLIFSPSTTDAKKLKLYPGIDMMTLINVGKKGQIPLGFIEVEL